MWVYVKVMCVLLYVMWKCVCVCECVRVGKYGMWNYSMLKLCVCVLLYVKFVSVKLLYVKFVCVWIIVVVCVREAMVCEIIVC